MKKTLISLVSDQTIPNILGIRHFEPDKLLFLTTSAMEEKYKTNAILRTLNMLGVDYRDRTSIIDVRENDFFKCLSEIDQWIQNNDSREFIVNLTCGTKIMSLAAFEYFRDYKSLMFYIPAPKNELTILFPRKADLSPAPISLRLSVSHYLTAYGLSIKNERKLEDNKKEARGRAKLSLWMANNYDSIKNLLVWLVRDEGGGLRNHRRDKKYLLCGTFRNPSENEEKFLNEFGFAVDDGRIQKELTKSEIQYLTGGWLEEYCFNEMEKFIFEGVDDVIIGPDVVNSLDRNNEFDVMFTKDNALYTVECKSLDQKEDKNQDILYKIGALQGEFGLRVESFLVSTAPDIMREGRIDPIIRDRAKQFNTTIIPGVDLTNFAGIVADKLKIKRMKNE